MYNLEKFGSFYIGGQNTNIEGLPTLSIRRNKDVTVLLNQNGTYSIEPMYVQYFLPPKCQDLYVLIHGGGHTGAVWETTVDGREGWLHLLLKQGIGIYIIDSIERGRSSWCSLPNIWPGTPEQKTHQSMWTAFRLGNEQDFEKKLPYKKEQFPIDDFLALTKYDVPRWNCNEEKSAQNLALLVKKIGKCSFIAHSQGAEIAMQCYNLVPDLINNIVLVEPASFPEINSIFCKTNILMLFGDYIKANQFWEPIKKCAIEYLEKLKQLKMNCSFVDLPEIGIEGNSHMMMMDK
jgi:pimeloyl-ACP methyl ester carboxylesterase